MTTEIKLNNEKRMPSIGIGTWQLTGNQCTESVKAAIAAGYNHIDTAEMYGNEEQIGEAIKEIPRDTLWITSKVWPNNTKKEKLKKACNESLRKLGTDYLDLYLIHWPTKEVDYKEAFTALKELYDEGRIKAVGVSNFLIMHLKEALPIAEEIGLPITVNQVEFHPGLYQKKLLEYCKEKNIAVTAYSPLGRGGLMDNAVIKEIGSAHKKTPAQVCIKWALQHGLIVIPKATSEEHIKENLDVFDFELTEYEMKRIDDIGDGDRIIKPHFWDIG